MSAATPAAPPGVGGCVYRVRSKAQLHWAGWGDEFVVFNESSGLTHQLDPLRAFVLNLLVESPRTRDQMLSELGSALHIDAPGADIPDVLLTVLSEFQQQGLVDTHNA